MPKVKRGAPAHRVDADHRDQQPEHGHDESRPAATVRPRPVMRHRPTSISAKNSGGPNLNATARAAAHDDQRNGGGDAADERADGGNPERGAAAALLRHLIAVEDR